MAFLLIPYLMYIITKQEIHVLTNPIYQLS